MSGWGESRVRWSRWEPLFGIHSFDFFLISVTYNIKSTYQIAMPTMEIFLHRPRIFAPSTDVWVVGETPHRRFVSCSCGPLSPGHAPRRASGGRPTADSAEGQLWPEGCSII